MTVCCRAFRVSYIRFDVENSLPEMIDSEELTPVVEAMREALGMDAQQAKGAFLPIALYAHGYASIMADNALALETKRITAHLERSSHRARKPRAARQANKPLVASARRAPRLSR